MAYKLKQAAIISSLLLAGCRADWSVLPPPPVHTNGQALWEIVNEKCVPNERAHGDPDPCATVDLRNGYAILKDRNGASQYLVMPTKDITGIEDQALLAPDAADYFSPAWQARHLVEQRLGSILERDDVGVAVNSIYGRSQDLLHLHVDCLDVTVRDTLHRELSTIKLKWSRRPLTLSGHSYFAMRINGENTVEASPFRLVSQGFKVPPGEMGDWTIVLAGAKFPDGKPGFILLAARANPARGFNGSGENLLDHDCKARSKGARLR